MEEHVRWLNFEATRNRELQDSQRFTTLYGHFSSQSPSARYNPDTPRTMYPASPNVLQFSPRSRNTLDNIDDDLPRPQDYVDNRDAVINRAMDSANEINQQRTPPPQPSTSPTPAAPSRVPSLSRIPPLIPFGDAGGTVPQTPSNVNESDDGATTVTPGNGDNLSDSSSSNAGSIDTRTASNVASRNNMVQSLLDQYDIIIPFHAHA